MAHPLDDATDEEIAQYTDADLIELTDLFEKTLVKVDNDRLSAERFLARLKAEASRRASLSS